MCIHPGYENVITTEITRATVDKHITDIILYIKPAVVDINM